MPIGAWWGNGRKAGWFSPYLLACVTPDGEMQSVCKVMSGFTDEQYREFLAFYKDGGRIIPQPKSFYDVTDDLIPSVWFEPCQVQAHKPYRDTWKPLSDVCLVCVCSGVGDPRRRSDDISQALGSQGPRGPHQRHQP